MTENIIVQSEPEQQNEKQIPSQRILRLVGCKKIFYNVSYFKKNLLQRVRFSNKLF